MIVSRALEELTNTRERGIAVHYTVLADMMRISHCYAQLLCKLLGRDDYVVIDATGRCKITPKGENFLKDLTRLKECLGQISPRPSILLEKTIEEVHGILIEQSRRSQVKSSLTEVIVKISSLPD